MAISGGFDQFKQQFPANTTAPEKFPAEQAAGEWASAKERLSRAQMAANAAQAELVEATRAEQQAWAALEVEAGRAVPERAAVAAAAWVPGMAR